jgi:hypothetical protein
MPNLQGKISFTEMFSGAELFLDFATGHKSYILHSCGEIMNEL